MYFSFDSGQRIQPTYHGLPQRAATQRPSRARPAGADHTIPNYFETACGPAATPAAFGPAQERHVLHANGTRLYYATLATNLTDTRIEQGGINSNTAITVSHIDNLTAARVADQSNWSKPYFVPANIAATAGLDKEQL